MVSDGVDKRKRWIATTTKGRRMMDKLTDFELNKAIAEVLGVKIPRASVIKSSPFLDIKDNVIISFNDDGSRYDELFPGYCNSWNDLMPLVVEYSIQFFESRASGDWYATKYLSDDIKEAECIQVRSDNPQRALAECVLRVLQEKQGDENSKT